MGNFTFTTYSGQLIDLYPTQAQDCAIEVTYSAVPTGDIADVDLQMPEEARDAIVALALADLLAIPGQGQNLAYAQDRRGEFERLKSGLRSLAVLGYGGTAQFQAPLFGGLGNRFWPYFFVPTTLPGPNGS